MGNQSVQQVRDTSNILDDNDSLFINNNEYDRIINLWSERPTNLIPDWIMTAAGLFGVGVLILYVLEKSDFPTMSHMISYMV